MASPLNLRVDVDFSQLITAAKRASSSADDVADAYDDAGKGADDFADAATDAGRDAERSAERATDAVDDVGDASEKAGDKAGKLGGAFADAGDIVSDAMSGDAAGAVEGLAGTVSNLAGSLPIVGTAIAGAGAVVAGVFSAMSAEAEATKQVISDMYDDMVESGNRALSETFLLAEAQKLIGDDARLEQARKYSDLLGVDMYTVIGALIGDTEDLATVQGILGEKLDAAGGKVEAFSSTQSAAAGEAQALFAALQGARGEFDLSAAAVDSAGDKYQLFNGYTKDLAANADDAKSSVGDLNSVMDALPTTGVTIPLRVDDTAVRNWKPPKWYADVLAVPQPYTFGSKAP